MGKICGEVFFPQLRQVHGGDKKKTANRGSNTVTNPGWNSCR